MLDGCGASRPKATTRQPRRARSALIPAPIPNVPPVTMTTRSSIPSARLHAFVPVPVEIAGVLFGDLKTDHARHGLVLFERTHRLLVVVRIAPRDGAFAGRRG